MQLQRRALLEALWERKEPLSTLARRFNISRKTLYKWKRRHAEGGLPALEDRRRVALRQPTRTPESMVEAVIALRHANSSWGPKKLRKVLARQKPRLLLPSERTIARYLRARGLLRPRPRRALPGPQLPRRALVVPQRPNDVWTVDFKGWFRTGDHARCEPLTVRDLFSRMVLAIEILPDAQYRTLRASFTKLFRRYGLPATIRVDNGRSFASAAPYGCSSLSLWWMRLGITVNFTRPGCPQDNGSHEQFHRVYKNETLQPPAHSLRAQQLRSRRWMAHYNSVRPHEALGLLTPASIYRKSRRSYRPLKKSFAYPSSWPTCRVGPKGYIRWRGRVRLLSRLLASHRVALRPISPSVVEVYLDHILLGSLHQNDPGGMRPAFFSKKCYLSGGTNL